MDDVQFLGVVGAVGHGDNAVLKVGQTKFLAGDDALFLPLEVGVHGGLALLEGQQGVAFPAGPAGIKAAVLQHFQRFDEGGIVQIQLITGVFIQLQDGGGVAAVEQIRILIGKAPAVGAAVGELLCQLHEVFPVPLALGVQCSGIFQTFLLEQVLVVVQNSHIDLAGCHIVLAAVGEDLVHDFGLQVGVGHIHIGIDGLGDVVQSETGVVVNTVVDQVDGIAAAVSRHQLFFPVGPVGGDKFHLDVGILLAEGLDDLVLPQSFIFFVVAGDQNGEGLALFLFQGADLVGFCAGSAGLAAAHQTDGQQCHQKDSDEFHKCFHNVLLSILRASADDAAALKTFGEEFLCENI